MVTKLQDVVLYRDERYFCAFPSVVRRPDGELILAFRRAPERRPYGGRCTHADPNSQLVLIRSHDDGKTWSADPELIHAHELGGSQDPCLTLLPDGQLLCASYLWMLQQPRCPVGGEYDQTGWKQTFAGGFTVRSRDGGQHWGQRHEPISVPGCVGRDALGKPLPAYNRGNILVGSDGVLYWAVVRADDAPFAGTGGLRTSVHLLASHDLGLSWTYRCPIAIDPHIGFNETFLYETPSGRLVAFLRTADEAGKVTNAIAFSSPDKLQCSPWEPLPFIGHPHHAARLPDGRVLLTYGYRAKPYGIRGRVLDAECQNASAAAEFVIRDDGGSPDLGYPWSISFPDGRVLVTYYFNLAHDLPTHWPASEDRNDLGMTVAGGVRHLAGSWLQL